jgi:hypothetical protein
MAVTGGNFKTNFGFVIILKLVVVAGSKESAILDFWQYGGHER